MLINGEGLLRATTLILFNSRNLLNTINEMPDIGEAFRKYYFAFNSSIGNGCIHRDKFL